MNQCQLSNKVLSEQNAALKQRIEELECQVKELEENLDIEREELQSLEADIACYENNEIKLNEKIEQLRNQIANISEMAFLGLNTQVRKALKELCDALEQTK